MISSQSTDFALNGAYLQPAGFLTNSSGVSPILHSLYSIEGPFLPGLPDRVDSVFRRSLIYSSMDQSVASSGSVYHTNFFSAASDVTSLLGLTGAQAVSMLTSPVGAWPFSPVTLRNMQQLGGDLYQYVNVPLYRAVYNGNSDFRLQTGVTLGSVASHGTSFLDYSLVHNEQTYVQRFLNRLPAYQRTTMINEANNAINLSISRPTVQAVDSLGHPFNFANQLDREAIGYAGTRAQNRNFAPGRW